MKNLKELLETLKENGTLDFMHTSVLGLGEPELFRITKHTEGNLPKGAIDGGMSIHKTNNTGGSWNTRSISRGYLNMYTFDIFDNLITTRILVKDMTLIAIHSEKATI